MPFPRKIFPNAVLSEARRLGQALLEDPGTGRANPKPDVAEDAASRRERWASVDKPWEPTSPSDPKFRRNMVDISEVNPARPLSGREARLANRALELRGKSDLLRTAQARERYAEADASGRNLVRDAGRADRDGRDPDGVKRDRTRAAAAEPKVKGPRSPERFAAEVLDRLLGIRKG